jgi:hypothetical protein
MSRGPSGRIVVELETGLKRRLYASLAGDGLTFKDWLIDQAERYLSARAQPSLKAAEPDSPSYGKEEIQNQSQDD